MKRNLLKMLTVAMAAFSMWGSALAQDLDGGSYYMLNVASGTYLAGANKNGTQLSLKRGGEPMTLTWDSDLAAYTMKDASLKSETSKFVGYSADEVDNPEYMYVNAETPTGGFHFQTIAYADVAALLPEETDVVLDENATYYKIQFTDYEESSVYLTNSGQRSNVSSGQDYVYGYKKLTIDGVWRLFTREELISYLRNTATNSNPLYATSLVNDPDFSVLRNSSVTTSGSWWNISSSNKNINGLALNYCCESWRATFNFYQTISDLPNGIYSVTAQASVCEYTKTGVDLPHLYVTASDEKQTSAFNVSSRSDRMENGEYTMAEMSTTFNNATNYLVTPIQVTIYDHKMTVGFECDRSDTWSIWDNIQLVYLGPAADELKAIKEKYETVVETATDLTYEDMNKDVLEALKTAINTSVEEESETGYNNLISLINEAITNAKTSISNYKQIADALTNTYPDMISELDQDGQDKWNSYNFTTLYENATLVSLDDIEEGYREAVKAQTTEGADMTAAIINPSFEREQSYGYVYGWEVVDWSSSSASDMRVAALSNATYAVPNGYAGHGSNVFNIWSYGHTIKQVLGNMKAGSYTLTAMGATDANQTFYLRANGEVATASSHANGKTYGVLVQLDFNQTKTGDMTISFDANGSWYKCDNFTLVYNGPLDLSTYYDKITSLTQDLNSYRNKKMHYEVQSLLLQAFSKGQSVVNNNSSMTDIDDLNDLIDELETTLKKVEESVGIYDSIIEYVTKAQDLDSDGESFFNDLATDITEAINSGTITDGTEELEKIEEYYISSVKQQSTPNTEMTEAIVNNDCGNGLSFNANGWNTSVYPRQTPIGWNLYNADDQTLIEDLSLHVNNWSVEADDNLSGNGGDGSAMTVPFAELYNFKYSSNYYNHILVQHDEETGYRTGRYKIQIYCRMRETSPDTAEPEGMTFYCNEVKSTTSYVQGSNPQSKAWYAWYEVEFVIDDGNFKFGFDLDNWNFNWLAFKLIRLTYIDDQYTEDQVQELLATVPAGKMNAAVQSALDEAVDNFSKNSVVETDKALRTAISNANTSIALYQSIANDLDKYSTLAQDLDAAGEAYYANSIKYIEEGYEKGTLTTNEVYETYVSAIRNQGAGSEMTLLINNPSFENGTTGWTISSLSVSGSNDTGARAAHDNATYQMENSDGDYLFNTWYAGFGLNVTQTIKNLQNGRYLLTAVVGSDPTIATFLTAQTSQELVYKGKVTTSKSAGLPDSLEFEVNDGTVTIGACGGNGTDWTNNEKLRLWYKVDNFKLFYLGATTSETYLQQLAAVIENATKYYDYPMNADIKTAFKNALDAGNAATVDNTIQEIKDMIDDIATVLKSAQKSIAVYESVNTYYTYAQEHYDADGVAEYLTLAASVVEAYNNGTITDGESEIEIAQEALVDAAKAQTTDGADMTGAIRNFNFESIHSHYLNNWKTSKGYSQFVPGYSTDVSWSNEGKIFAYAENLYNATSKNVDMKQILDGMRPGIYSISFISNTNLTDEQVWLMAGSSSMSYITTDKNSYEMYFLIYEEEPDLTLNFRGVLNAGQYVAVDDIKLTYHGLTVTLEPETRPMLAADSIAQAKAYALFIDDDKRNYLKEIKDLTDAIENAKKSADAYAYAKYVTDSSRNYINNASNVYSRRAKDYVTKLLDDFEDKYNKRTLIPSDAYTIVNTYLHRNNYNGDNYQTDFNGFYWDYDNDGIADRFNEEDYPEYPVIYYMYDAWRLKRKNSNTEVYADENFHANTWSDEGDQELHGGNRSGMTTPFIEYWRDGSGGMPLEEATIEATAIDLEPGLYTVSVFTRSMMEKGSTADTELKGIHLYAYGKYNTTDTVDVTKGKQYIDWGGKYNFAGTYRVDSLIIREKDCTNGTGTARIVLDISDSTNVNWFAFKFAYVKKTRDLYWWEEDTPATQEELDQLDELIAFGKDRTIGFCQDEYATYANVDVRMALDEAVEYRKGVKQVEENILQYIQRLQKENWHRNMGDTNAIYNPNFSYYNEDDENPEITAWRIKDTFLGIDGFYTGGTGNSAIYSNTNVQNFNNKLANKQYSTVAYFRFASSITGSTSKYSEYYYGDSAYYEMPLRCEVDEYTGALGTPYRLKFEYGAYLNTRVISDGAYVGILNPDGSVLAEWQLKNLINAADTDNVPMIFEEAFVTEQEGNHSIYFRNANTNTSWSMICSNMELTRKPKVVMQITAAKYGTFICPFDVRIPKESGIKAYAVVGLSDSIHSFAQDAQSEYVGKYRTLILDENVTVPTKVIRGGKTTIVNMTFNMNSDSIIPAHTPVVVKCNEAKSLTFGGIETTPVEGTESLTYGLLTGFYNDTVATNMDSNADTTYYVLQRHNPNKEACFYRISYADYLTQYGSPLDLTINQYRAILKYPTDDLKYLTKENDGETKIRMLSFRTLDELMEEATIVSDITNDEKEVTGYYSVDGSPRQALQKGINIVRYSDGSSKKIYIK